MWLRCLTRPSPSLPLLVAFFSVIVLRFHFPSIGIDDPLSVLRSLSLQGVLSRPPSTPYARVPCSDRSNFQYNTENERRASGLHLLCVTSPGVMKVYRHTLEGNAYDISKVRLVCPCPPSTLSTRQHHPPYPTSQLSQLNLDRKTPPLHKFVIFTPTGEKVYTEDRSSKPPDFQPGLYLIFEGGVFMWPGVRKGFVRQHPNLPLTIRTLSVMPLVLEVEEDFINPSEISLIKTLSEPQMKSSGVSLMDKDKGKAATEWRTSSTYFLPTRKHDLLQAVDERVSDLTFIPLNHSELIQVLRYGPTQKYDGHHDYFDPALYKGDPATIRLIGKHGERNR